MLEGIDPDVLAGAMTPQPDDNELKKRVCNLVSAMRESRARIPPLLVVKEGGPQEARFYWHLVEDRQNFPNGSFAYQEYLNHASYSIL